MTLIRIILALTILIPTIKVLKAFIDLGVFKKKDPNEHTNFMGEKVDWVIYDQPVKTATYREPVKVTEVDRRGKHQTKQATSYDYEEDDSDYYVEEDEWEQYNGNNSSNYYEEEEEDWYDNNSSNSYDDYEEDDYYGSNSNSYEEDSYQQFDQMDHNSTDWGSVDFNDIRF